MAFTAANTFIPWDPLRALKDTVCAACGAPGARSKCGACKFAKFCGPECQRSAWADHKVVCAHGYSGYIALVEQHQKRAGPLVLANDHKGVIGCHKEMLATARAFGDIEGVRHNLRALAFRCEALELKVEAASYATEADRVEAVVGNARHSAKQVFGQIDHLPPTHMPEQQQQLPELAGLLPRVDAPSQPRGAKMGTLSWCQWAQSISDVTVTVPLPPGVTRRSLSITFGRQSLRVALAGGVVIAEERLHGRILTDECTWTMADGAACIVLEKAERIVWDWCDSQTRVEPGRRG